MRQSGLQALALETAREFPEYLRENRLAPPGHIPFLRRWAEQYLTAPHDPALQPDDRLRAFLDKLQRNAALVDWQTALAGTRKILRLRNYSPRTEETYLDWAWRFAQYCRMKAPSVRARRGPKLPVIFSRDEVQRLFAVMEGTTKLMAQLTYGAGLRLMECVRLRVKDIDFDQFSASSCSCSCSCSCS